MQRVLLDVTVSLPTPAQQVGCRTAATVILLYPSSTVLLIPPTSKLVFYHRNFESLSHSDHSCTHWNPSVIAGGSHHLGNGSKSCSAVGAVGRALHSLSLQPPAEQQDHSSQHSFPQPAALSRGKLQNDWGRWFWLQAHYFTAPSRLDVARGLPLDFPQSCPYPNKYFSHHNLPMKFTCGIFWLPQSPFGVCLCVVFSVESQEGEGEVRTERTWTVSSDSP